LQGVQLATFIDGTLNARGDHNKGWSLEVAIPRANFEELSSRPEPLYYTSPKQLAAALPASTPVGTGTLTVTYRDKTSAPSPIQVVPTTLLLAKIFESDEDFAGIVAALATGKLPLLHQA
jgi:uncharacterized protein (TIGR03437 family)